VIKLKNILKEGFAWERKADGSLPTLADTTAAYEAKMREQAELNMPGLDDEEEVDIDSEETVDEEAKPDYIDLDDDGDEEESMKKAAADKKDAESKDVNESLLITKGGEQALRQTPLLERIRKNYNGNN
jgi:hypothetical protein